MSVNFEGWQPGIQEGAADWDETWDKFEDEGIIQMSLQKSIFLFSTSACSHGPCLYCGVLNEKLNI